MGTPASGDTVPDVGEERWTRTAPKRAAFGLGSLTLKWDDGKATRESEAVSVPSQQERSRFDENRGGREVHSVVVAGDGRGPQCNRSTTLGPVVLPCAVTLVWIEAIVLHGFKRFVLNHSTRPYEERSRWTIGI